MDSTLVWDGNVVVTVLGFGVNLITILVIAVLGVTKRNAQTSTRIRRLIFLEKIFWYLLPSLGACLSFYEMVLLTKRALQEHSMVYHEWVFRFSQLLVWVLVILFWWSDYWTLVFCDRVLCFWWIAKPLLTTSHLVSVYSSLQENDEKGYKSRRIGRALAAVANGNAILEEKEKGKEEEAVCSFLFLVFFGTYGMFSFLLKTLFFMVMDVCKESSSILLDVVFGVYVNVVRVMQISTRSRKCGLEDPLLECEAELEELCHRDLNINALSYWHILTFKFVNPVMDCGSRKQLDFDDLIQLPIELNPSSCFSTLLSCWETEESKNPSHPSLLKAICYAYGWPYLFLGLLKVFNDCFGFVGPMLLNKLIWFLQRGVIVIGSGNLDGYILTLSLGLSSVIKLYWRRSFLDTQYTFNLSKLKLKLRASIMTVIYRKCLCVSLADRSNFSEGEIQTFMSIDAERTVNLCNSLHDMWSLPLQIGVALYLLYTQVKFAFVSGITITVILIPVNRWLSKLIARATEEMMTQKDERIRRAGELLTHIRTLKMYGWELLFANRLRDTRSLEVKYLSTRKYLDAWCVFFWATTPTLFSLFTFGLFTLTGHTLNAATVFTCLALFNTLISPLNSFPWVINGLIDATISTRRLSTFLTCSEHDSKEVHTAPLSSPYVSEFLAESVQHMAVVARDISSSWSTSIKEQSSVLHHITLDLPKGFLITVIGEVGAGKSSLLNSILGEMRLIQGSIYSQGSVAYVPQVPWILSGSIRDNILFGKNYDAKRYTEVVHACELDFDISLMVGGDLAYIGEKGLNLSGLPSGVVILRAVYSGANLFLLDDVLSAVDAQVASMILYKAILGPLMNQQTRILCTHNPQAISSADMIVVMEKGHVKWTGSLAQFLASPYSTFPSLNESMVSSSPSSKQETRSSTSSNFKETLHQERDYANISEEAQVIETESRREGKLDYSVYKTYAKYFSWTITIVICLSAFLMQASRNGNDLWLSFWVDTAAGGQKAKYSTSFYLVILCIFCITNSLLTLIRAFSFAYGGLRAAVHVHTELLDKLVSAPIRFFDETPSGRILNRLSSDLYTIDDALPFILNILLANFIGLVGLVIVLSYVQFWLVLTKTIALGFMAATAYRHQDLGKLEQVSSSATSCFLDPAIALLVYIQKATDPSAKISFFQFYYRSTSRELRRLDSVSRSPIYASFTETLDGSSTIRAFKAKECFLARFTEHVALYQRTSYTEITASLWLSLRLQFLAAFVISFIAVMAVAGSRGGFPINFSTPGLVGLALSYAAPFVSLLSSYLASFTETEKEMVSVERVLQYMDVPQEDIKGCIFVPPHWPFQGQIDFDHVTLRYMPYLPSALHDVTFTVAGGTQVGIIGRTGAGKSSVLNALFRLTPICGGRILVDRLNVADISIRDLRSHFSVVPQSPFLFEGSLRKVKVLCLDECSANIDTQTASSLQNAISSHCENMTVLTIAHRISTVMNMNNIFILDQGILVEQGDPQALLQDESSRFSSFANASIM
ncbi:hypothetical protein IFM89_010477 [Coptis chinensis]|uniref:ABC-type xenobiotic transporter n=1 Tax=Coptis chinensis TaxID=261450 RepID=A0A835M2A0_9MAGN|nr:hypothetical protein IFM89_010477 [Coptis chinensis]